MSAATKLLPVLAAVAACISVSARAEYPEKPIKMIIPYTPGGPADQMGRGIGPKMNQAWGQPVIMDYKPGAGLAVGADFVAKAPADGYTLLLGASSMFVESGESTRTPADNLRDFAPISLVGSFPLVVASSTQFAPQNTKELIAYAKANPGKVNFGTSGVASLTHLAGALFMQMTGTHLVSVPFKGINEAMNDLVAGRIQLSFAGPPSALPLVKGGKLRAIGVTGLQRFTVAPDIPTIAETGVPGYEVTPWYGVLAPKATTAAVANRLHGEIVNIMKSDDIKQNWKNMGIDVHFSKTPAEMGSVMQAEAAKWTKLIKDGWLDK